MSRHPRAHRNNRRCDQTARNRRRWRGDWVLVHVGFAMSRINEEEAAQTLKILIELGEAQAEIEAMRLSAAQ